MVFSLEEQGGAVISQSCVFSDMVRPPHRSVQLGVNILEGGTLVSRGEISVGDLTSLLLYTAYVGSGLQMLT